MTKLRITIDGVSAVAELKDAAAPAGVAAVVGALPLRTRFVHASRSGNCAVAHDASLQHPSVGIEGQVSMYYPGMLAYDPARGHLVLAYGQGQARSNTGTHWVTYLGDVVENLAELAVKLQDTRDHGALDVRIELGE
ncbi:DUF3830 family protein [Jiangella asiatica]|uniref:DUF3830 family protein n=1 Tax=Jiangella asiatica TaxID=2530372 RepID=UPI0013A5D972|nr:DUF3830 family protein [Jiangella asiatica]